MPISTMNATSAIIGTASTRRTSRIAANARQRAERDAQHAAQHVHRGQDDAKHGNRRYDPHGFEQAQQRQELADEAGQARQSERRHARRSRMPLMNGMFRASPPRSFELRGSGSLVDAADEQEHQRGDEAVRDELEHGAVQPDFVESGDPEQHDAHMADTRVGQHELEFLLDQREHRAVQDIDDTEDREHQRPFLGLLREQQNAETDAGRRPPF